MRLLDLFAITEARRNADHPSQMKDRTPGKGPATAMERLSKYVKMKNVFISFTQLPKAGINPTSKYDTPLGVYAYPLKKYYDPNETTPANLVPFAADAPWIMVLQATQPIMDVSAYTEGDWERDRAELGYLIGHDEVAALIQQLAPASLPNGVKRIKPQSPIAMFWKVTRAIANGPYKQIQGGKGSVRWNSLMRHLGYHAFSDLKGTGLIHTAEPFQAFFLTGNSFKVMDKIESNLPNAYVYADKMKQAVPMTHKERQEKSMLASRVKKSGGVLKFLTTHPEYIKYKDRPFEITAELLDALHKAGVDTDYFPTSVREGIIRDLLKIGSELPYTKRNYITAQTIADVPRDRLGEAIRRMPEYTPQVDLLKFVMNEAPDQILALVDRYGTDLIKGNVILKPLKTMTEEVQEATIRSIETNRSENDYQTDPEDIYLIWAMLNYPEVIRDVYRENGNYQTDLHLIKELALLDEEGIRAAKILLQGVERPERIRSYVGSELADELLS